jgi:hypothetical protein
MDCSLAETLITDPVSIWTLAKGGLDNQKIEAVMMRFVLYQLS